MSAVYSLTILLTVHHSCRLVACPLTIYKPPSPPRSPLFPYTTLFRSNAATAQLHHRGGHLGRLAREDQNLCCGSHRAQFARSAEHTSELQSRGHILCRLLLE